MHTAPARLTAVVLLTGATLCSLPMGAQALWSAAGSSPGFERLVDPLNRTGRELSLQFYRELKTVGRGRATGDHEDALDLTARLDGLYWGLFFGGVAAPGALVGRGRRSSRISPTYRPYLTRARRFARRP